MLEILLIAAFLSAMGFCFYMMARSSETKPAPRPAPDTAFDGMPYVRELQNELIARDRNALPKHGVDGLFGPETLAAAKKWMKARPKRRP